MTVTAQMRGHAVYHDGTVWRHADDHSLAPASGGAERPCTHCGLVAEDGYGPDPCLGWGDGPGCCGHGQTEPQLWAWGPVLACALVAAFAVAAFVAWGWFG